MTMTMTMMTSLILMMIDPLEMMHHIDSCNFCSKYRVQATIYTVGFLRLSCPSFCNNRALKVEYLSSNFAVQVAACQYAGDNTVNRINYPKATILNVLPPKCTYTVMVNLQVCAACPVTVPPPALVPEGTIC